MCRPVLCPAARLQDDDIPLVVGCGAIGQAMIMALRLTNCRPIIASDPAPGRRAMRCEWVPTSS